MQSVLDSADLEIKLGQTTLWGVGRIPPGTHTLSTTIDPYIIPAELQLCIHTSEGIYTIPTATSPLPKEVSPIFPAIGSKTLTYQQDGEHVDYVVEYSLGVNFRTATIALFNGAVNALILFVTTLIDLMVRYVQALGFLSLRALSKLFRSKNDRIDRSG
jgi:hypothetical protein